VVSLSRKIAGNTDGALTFELARVRQDKNRLDRTRHVVWEL
jgi:hypothetical protein